MSEIIVDTGPLVAMLVRTDDHHAWAFDREHGRRAIPLITPVR